MQRAATEAPERVPVYMTLWFAWSKPAAEVKNSAVPHNAFETYLQKDFLQVYYSKS